MKRDEKVHNEGGRLVTRGPSPKDRPITTGKEVRQFVESGKAAQARAALASYRSLNKAWDERRAQTPTPAFAGGKMLDTASVQEHAAKGKEMYEKMRALEKSHPGIYHMAKAADLRESGHHELAAVHEKAAASLNGEWDEAKHPRDEAGRFT